MPSVTTKPRQIPADYLRQGDWVAVFDDIDMLCGSVTVAERGDDIRWERVAEIRPVADCYPDIHSVTLENDDPGEDVIQVRTVSLDGDRHVVVRELLSVDDI